MGAALASGGSAVALESSINAGSKDRTTQRLRVFDLFNSAGAAGFTDDEAEAVSGMTHTSVSPRRFELWLMGCVAAAGDTRITRQGEEALVWRVVPLDGRKDAARKAQIESAQMRVVKGQRMIATAEAELRKLGALSVEVIVSSIA